MQICCRAVSATFGESIVLNRVSCDVPEGTFVCVLGINGVGKSTLLRAIAGLLPITGEVAIDGAVVAAMSPRSRARTISYLPQTAEVAWPITARDVVMLGRMPHLSSLAGPAEADLAAVDAALANVDATMLADRLVTELSGGEKARVLLARALAVAAPVLLADEPIAALDPRHQIEVMELFQREAKAGRTVLAAVHDLALASRYAGQVIVLSAGGVAACGPPSEVLTDALVASAFGVEIVAAERNGLRAIVPWVTT
jgi:iron complex transport system ATP-binding protein